MDMKRQMKGQEIQQLCDRGRPSSVLMDAAENCSVMKVFLLPSRPRVTPVCEMNTVLLITLSDSSLFPNLLPHPAWRGHL